MSFAKENNPTPKKLVAHNVTTDFTKNLKTELSDSKNPAFDFTDVHIRDFQIFSLQPPVNLDR